MSEMAPSVWTDERLRQLEALWSEGLSITQIGAAIGVSRNAVVGKVHRMGLPKRQSPIVRSDKPRKIKRRKAATPALADWNRGQCSWPIGDPKSSDFHFCGDKIVPGRPYCEAHCAKAYTTLREKAA